MNEDYIDLNQVEEESKKKAWDPEKFFDENTLQEINKILSSAKIEQTINGWIKRS